MLDADQEQHYKIIQGYHDGETTASKHERCALRGERATTLAIQDQNLASVTSRESCEIPLEHSSQKDPRTEDAVRFLSTST